MTRTRQQRNRPRIRLIWDELLGNRVPHALRVLGFNVTWIGADDLGVPLRGSADPEIIDFARRTNQVIVTSNHDMMTLCDESGQRFVWIDPYGKTLNAEAQVFLVFRQVAKWEQLLNDHPNMCVIARRSGCKPIASSEAARLAHNRMRALERMRRSTAVRRQMREGDEPMEDM